MRFTGKLHTWSDDRGFGFIRPTDGGPSIFVHASALPKPRPGPEEELTFEVGLNPQGKKRALNVRLQETEAAALQADKMRQGVRSHAEERPERGGHSGVRAIVVALLVLCGFSIYAYQQKARKQSRVESAVVSEPAVGRASAPVSAPLQTSRSAKFSCDGRTMCSQMKSCEEATFFLKNCPGVKMDGNNDGVPCERQWCK